MWTNLDRVVRALRLRRGWTQEELGRRAALSRDVVSRLERGQLSGLTLGTIDRVVRALEASVQLTLRWHGEQLDRLLDAAHAALQQAVGVLLTGLRWQVRVEVSFNHFGERGRIDLLAYDAARRILLVVEIKSAIGDLQETLGRLDIKVRVAMQVARDLGWTDVSAVLPVLVIADSRRARRVVADHDQLFNRFDVRGRTALAWLRKPSQPTPMGLLWFANGSDSSQLRVTRDRRAPKRTSAHPS
jgi:transcriptional regulator with XRE-family HTH domain